MLHGLDVPDLPQHVTDVCRPLLSIAGLVGKAARPDAKLARFGGKATLLSELLAQGFPVPAGWVIDTKVFEQFCQLRLPKGHDLASLVRAAGTDAGTDKAARARDRILSGELPEDVDAALAELGALVEPVCPWGFAVRSSATAEDSRGASMAGLASTLLGVRSAGLSAALKEVWASLFLPRTLLYLARLNVKNAAMGVVLMPVVRARAAGVLFTAPPPGLEGERWRADERLLHVTLGLGAPVVDGARVTDTVRMARDGTLIESVVAEKKTKLIVTEAGLETVPTTAEEARSPVLSDRSRHELARVANFLVEHHQMPLDVEFALEEAPDGTDSVVLLQARPITWGGYPEGGDAETVWSRANVGEALPGAATPLTWSIARRFSDAGFRAAFAALGCSVPKGAVLVSNVMGRFYLNLTTFMEVAGQVPGLSPRMLLEQSGGAPDGVIARLELDAAKPSSSGFVVKAPFTLPKLVLRALRLEAEVFAWEAEAERRYRSIQGIDLEVLPDDALAQTLDRASTLLFDAGELMLTCASASLVANLALTKTLSEMFTRRSIGSEPANEASRVAQALTAGISDLESANPGLSLVRLANLARTDPVALEYLAGDRARRGTFEALPTGPTRSALLEFLERFGDRAVREAELATPRWREDPDRVVAMLQATLRGPAIEPDDGPRGARAQADREMLRLEGLVPFPVRLLIAELVAKVRMFTRLRERMRAWVTRSLGLIRWVSLEIDRRLIHIEPTLEPGSVFFCTFEELTSALRTGRAEVAHIIRLRKAEHLRDQARPDPPPAFIGRPPAVTLPPSSSPMLVGLAASPGVVVGYARVVGQGSDSVGDLEPGEILVARSTDIGMSPLFLVAAGVVTELGGPLSHAAIVAREYNVPAVVNVDGCTLSLRTGDRLRVDGDRGTVERLTDSPA